MSADVPFHVNAIAGGLGGVAQVIVGQPLDYIKTQVQRGNTSYGVTPRELFRGMSAPLVSSAFLNVVLFSTTGLSRRLVARHNEPITLGQVVAAALLTAPIYTAFVSPVEFIKVNLMATPAGGPIQVIRNEMAQHGPTVFWRGYSLTCGMRLWGLPFYFGANEATKRLLTAPGERASLPQLMVAGGAAGVAFWAACFPLDTLKTLVQSSRNLSPVQAAVSLYRDSGVRGFYRGLAPCLARSVPANAVVFVVVDYVQKYLKA